MNRKNETKSKNEKIWPHLTFWPWIWLSVKCHFGNRVILKAWPIVILSGMVDSFEQKMPSKVFLRALDCRLMREFGRGWHKDISLLVWVLRGAPNATLLQHGVLSLLIDKCKKTVYYGATENAGVENAGVGSRGGKCRSSLAVDGQLNLECKERQH